MPELPETETIARDLHSTVRGARMLGATVHRADVLRHITADALPEHVAGLVITRVWRRAKLVVLDLARSSVANTSAAHLVVQPRFTGALLIDDGQLPADQRDYLTLTFPLADGRALHYRDVRRLGTVALLGPNHFVTMCAQLGIEPLDVTFTAAALREAIGLSRRPIKAALMDQGKVAGVGNIYAAESLWRARLDPSRECRKLDAEQWAALHKALQEVLAEAIVARGTSFRDYRDARGGRGAFVEQLAVYGRAGEPCRACERRLVSTQAIDGRSTVFCANCQR